MLKTDDAPFKNPDYFQGAKQVHLSYEVDVDSGGKRIGLERVRQLSEEGFSIEDDQIYTEGELWLAAQSYLEAVEQLETTVPNMIREAKNTLKALNGGTSVHAFAEARNRLREAIEEMEEHPEHFVQPAAWPWMQSAFKPSADPIRNLEKAGALIAAEIDRRLHAAAKADPNSTLNKTGV